MPSFATNTDRINSYKNFEQEDWYFGLGVVFISVYS